MPESRKGEVEFPVGAEGQELTRLRRRLEYHRRALEDLAVTAPGERLGRLYAELIDEVDSILERMPAVPRAAEPTEADASRLPRVVEVPGKGAAGTRRMVKLAALAAALFVSLGGLYWWTRERRAPVAEAVVTTKPAPIDAPAVARIATLTAKPSSLDFGSIRKGGRFVQTFTLFNDGDEPLDISVERSKCHCLWFQHDDQIPPRGSIPLVVALDTSQVEPGVVTETIRVKANDRPLQAEIPIRARVVATAWRPR